MDELAGTGRDAALEALVAMPVEHAVPALIECLVEKDTEHAWQARCALLRVVSVAGTKHDAWDEALTAHDGIVADTESPASRRAIAALAVGAMGERAKGSVGVLVDCFQSGNPHQVQLCAVIALAGVGAPACKKLNKVVNKGGNSTAVLLAVAALGCLGESGEQSRNDLLALVRRKDSIVASVVCLAASNAAVRVGATKSARSKAWEERAKLEWGRVLEWNGARFNYGSGVGKDPAVAASVLLTETGLKLSIPAEELSLPKKLIVGMTSGSQHTLADFIRTLFGHLSDESFELRGTLKADSVPTWSEWEQRTKGLMGTCELVWFVAPREE